MQLHHVVTFSLSLVLLVGCATPPQPPVALNKHALGSQGGRIAVAMTKLPESNLFTPGADCLVCYAAARMMHSSLIDHARTLTLEDLSSLKNDVAKLLRQQGTQVIVVEEPLDVSALSKWGGEGQDLAVQDYSPLQQKYGADRLLVLDIKALGFVRNYSSYIPSGAPKASLTGTGYMVELKSNHYDWYQPISAVKGADLVWDEPPKFPGLTNAFFQVVEMSRDQFLQPFAPGLGISLGEGGLVADGTR